MCLLCVCGRTNAISLVDHVPTSSKFYTTHNFMSGILTFFCMYIYCIVGCMIVYVVLFF